jgi:hypothetical protein
MFTPLRIGLLLLVSATAALALSGGTNIQCVNGTCGLTGTIGAGNGGRGIATTTDDAVDVGNGSALQSKVLPSCTGAGKAITYDQATNTFGCNTLASGAAPVVPFAVGMDLTTSITLFVAPGGESDQAEAVVTTPLPAGTFANLRCLNAAIQGASNNIVVTVRLGAAGSVTDQTTACTITGTTGANQACADTTNTWTTTAGQVLTLKIVTPATLTANARVNCSMERTA